MTTISATIYRRPVFRDRAKVGWPAPAVTGESKKITIRFISRFLTFYDDFNKKPRSTQTPRLSSLQSFSLDL